MAIPTDGLVLDFNPALAPEADGADILSVTVGGKVFAPSVPGSPDIPPATYATDGLGQRALIVPSTATMVSGAAAGIQPVSWAHLFMVPTGIASTSQPYIGPNDAVLTASTGPSDTGAKTYWIMRSGSPVGGEVIFPADVVGTMAMTLGADPDNAVAGYINGVSVVSGAGGPYPPAVTPSFLGVGHIYRSLWWNRELTAAEMAAVDAELRLPFIPVLTVAWEAPAHASSPVLGYQVSLLIGGAHTVVDLGPDVLTYDVAGSGAVEVRAVTAHGLSAPAQVTL